MRPGSGLTPCRGGVPSDHASGQGSGEDVVVGVIRLIGEHRLEGNLLHENSKVGWQQKRCKTTIDKVAWVLQCTFNNSIDLIQLVGFVYL